MLCQSCGQRPATVHIMKTLNNQKEEQHLCEVCAQEQGKLVIEPTFGFPDLSVQNILASLLNQEHWPAAPGGPGVAGHPAVPTRCPACGMTLPRLRETGYFGCPQCYEAFEAELGPLLRRIHGSGQHQGKIPRRTEGQQQVKRELAQLRRDLQQAVAAENYEEAGHIHVRIKAVEQKLEAGGGANAVE